ncbi:MAG: tetratricopeptide repeat protein [Flavobacteriales bacterium]
MKNKTFLLLLVLSSITTLAQHPNQLIRSGNYEYQDSSFTESEKYYREALIKKPGSFEASFNLADAIYKQENFSESSSLFNALAEKTEQKIEKSKSFHNLGNSLFKEQKIDEAIEAYKNALRNNPDDIDTKFNLAYAQKLKQQQQNQKQEKEEQEEEQQEEEQQENKNEQSKEQSKEEPKQPQDPNEMTEEEAQQILDALQQQEREVQEDLQKKKSKGVKLKILKDW